LDNPKDAAFLEEEAMKAKERESSTQKQKPKDEHFTKLQDELMAEIEAETRKMVEDAGIVSVDEMFLSEKEVQNDGYTIDGAPNAEFVSVEKQVSERKQASFEEDENTFDGSREMAADILATSTTKLTHLIRLAARLVRSCLIKNAPRFARRRTRSTRESWRGTRRI